MQIQKINTRQRSEMFPLTAPVGGLNGRDALSAMDQLDAYQLDNMFPGTTSVDVRTGCAIQSTPTTAPVMSIATYSPATGIDQIIAWSGTNCWNVSTSTPTSLRTDFLSDDIVTCMFGTVADEHQFLIVTSNSTDIPKYYNGTAMTDITFDTTAVPGDVSSMNFCCSFQGRMYYAIKGRMGFVYTPPGQFGGALNWFDLGQISRKGGFVQAIATFSDADSGDGPNEYICFITSKGEYICYEGYDPSDSSNFQLVGRYVSAEPIGRQCVCYLNGDLLILTNVGVVLLSQIRHRNDQIGSAIAISAKLGDTTVLRKDYQDTRGWSVILYPKGGWLVLTMPSTTSTSGAYDHFVMNTLTQAWCRFTATQWNGLCWTVANRRLYFGRYDGNVMLADEGYMDNGQQINFQCKQAYNMFMKPTKKLFHWLTPLFSSEAPILVTYTMNVDFVDKNTNPIPIPSGGTLGAQWDVTAWDQEQWSQGPYTQQAMQGVGKWGNYGSINLKGTVMGASLKWYMTRVIFETAQGILS